MDDGPRSDVGSHGQLLVSLLRAEADALRAELTRLRQEMLAGQGFAVHAPSSELLLEINERLVLAAIQAEIAAEAAAAQVRTLEHSCQRDALTGLPNRILMVDRMDKAISTARRQGDQLALFFVDLDGFKRVNDTLGHDVGDAVLQAMARRIQSSVRDSDTVSRHGGDEFLVLLTRLARTSDATMMATKLCANIAAPCTLAGQVLVLSASIGIAYYPVDGEDSATLIRRADAAMYEHKRGGVGGPLCTSG